MGRRNRHSARANTSQQIGQGVDASLYFNERDFQNYGKFVPFIINFGQSLSDPSVRVNEYQRRNLVDQSRNFVANLPEVTAAMQRLADFTVGTALIPIYNGQNQVWGNQIKRNYLDKVTNNLTRLGLAADWQSTWQLVLKTVLTDGDLLMIPYTDRYGLPKLDFVEGHRVAGRDGTSIVKGGRFDGYRCEDGVIYDSADTVMGYQIQGDTQEQDYTISKANCFLIYSPFSFKKGRGLPLLSAASRQARNLMDYQHYIPQIVKQEGGIQLIETNKEGKAPAGRTAYSAFNQVSPTNPTIGTTAVNAVTEYTQAGYRYIKTNGGKLESLKSDRPTREVQSYINATQKEMLCGLFPHQLLLSPETVGGPGARGMKEILVASINTHRAMIEKWALIALQFVLSVGMSNMTLQNTFDFETNFKEDFTDWSFTKAPEPVLDPGYERAADIADLNAGLKSPEEIVAKEGRNYDDVLREINNSAEKKAAMIEAFVAKYPNLALYAPQMFGLTKEPFPIAQPSNDNTSTDKTTTTP